MSDVHDPRVRCTVRARVPVEGGYRFDDIAQTNQRGSVWEVKYPPAIGDLVMLASGLFQPWS